MGIAGAQRVSNVRRMRSELSSISRSCLGQLAERREHRGQEEPRVVGDSLARSLVRPVDGSTKKDSGIGRTTAIPRPLSVHHKGRAERSIVPEALVAAHDCGHHGAHPDLVSLGHEGSELGQLGLRVEGIGQTGLVEHLRCLHCRFEPLAGHEVNRRQDQAQTGDIDPVVEDVDRMAGEHRSVVHSTSAKEGTGGYDRSTRESDVVLRAELEGTQRGIGPQYRRSVHHLAHRTVPCKQVMLMPGP